CWLGVVKWGGVGREQEGDEECNMNQLLPAACKNCVNGCADAGLPCTADCIQSIWDAAGPHCAGDWSMRTDEFWIEEIAQCICLAFVSSRAPPRTRYTEFQFHAVRSRKCRQSNRRARAPGAFTMIRRA